MIPTLILQTFEGFASDAPLPEDKIENDPCFAALFDGAMGPSGSSGSRAGSSRGAVEAASMTLPHHERSSRRSAAASAAVSEDDDKEKEIHLINNRKKRPCGGIHIKDPTDATLVRVAPLQSQSAVAEGEPASSAKMAEPSPPARKRQKAYFKPPRATA